MQPLQMSTTEDGKDKAQLGIELGKPYDIFPDGHAGPRRCPPQDGARRHQQRHRGPAARAKYQARAQRFQAARAAETSPTLAVNKTQETSNPSEKASETQAAPLSY